MYFSSVFVQKLRGYKKRNKRTFEKIQQALLLFESNPTHPSLRLHKLIGKLDERWSISASGSIRLVFFRENEKVIFYNAGTHDEVYRK